MASIRILESTKAQASLESWTPTFAGVTSEANFLVDLVPPRTRGDFRGFSMLRVTSV